MYGANVGTGVAGGSLLAVGFGVGSYALTVFAGLLLVAMIVGLARRGRRTGAHQRP